MPGRLIGMIARAREQAGFVVVEGAGGLLVPLAADRPYFTVADLLAGSGLPALVVARATLGTLNHTLLTVAELRRRGIEILGVVLNHLTPRDGPEAASNPVVLAEHGVRVLAEMPYLDPVSVEGAADALGRALTPDVLRGI